VDVIWVGTKETQTTWPHLKLIHKKMYNTKQNGLWIEQLCCYASKILLITERYENKSRIVFSMWHMSCMWNNGDLSWPMYSLVVFSHILYIYIYLCVYVLSLIGIVLIMQTIVLQYGKDPDLVCLHCMSVRQQR
jgi:hypothetical protein